jgi:hypothetical protein
VETSAKANLVPFWADAFLPRARVRRALCVAVFRLKTLASPASGRPLRAAYSICIKLPSG